MFTYWKIPYESTWGNPRSSDLTDVSPKDFFSLAESLHCENSPVTGEMMLEYMVERKREAIFKSVSLENVIRMAYDRLCSRYGEVVEIEHLRPSVFANGSAATIRRRQWLWREKWSSHTSLFLKRYIPIGGR